MKKIVSIIIPIYNSEKFLDNCLKSIQNQTFKNFEVIMINDGSTDNSLAIINQYAEKDNRFYVISQKNEGVCVARNQGIKLSTGKYILFVDSDDSLEEHALEYLVQIIEKEKVDLVRTNFYYINNDTIKPNDESLSYKGKITLTQEMKKNLIFEILDAKLNCFLWALFIKKSLITQNHIYFGKDLYVHQDIDYYISLLNHASSIYFSDIITYCYFLNQNGSKHLKYYERNIHSILALYLVLKPKIDENLLPKLKALLFNLITSRFKKMYEYDKTTFKNVCYDLLNNETFLEILENMKPFYGSIIYKILLICKKNPKRFLRIYAVLVPILNLYHFIKNK